MTKRGKSLSSRKDPDCKSTEKDIESEIASSYVTHGYGLKVLREILNNHTMTASQYNSYITQIMKKTFKSI